MFPSVQKASNSFVFFLKQQYWINVSLVTDFKFFGLEMFFSFQSLLITKLSRRYLQLIFVLIGHQKEFNSNSWSKKMWYVVVRTISTYGNHFSWISFPLSWNVLEYWSSVFRNRSVPLTCIQGWAANEREFWWRNQCWSWDRRHVTR